MGNRRNSGEYSDIQGSGGRELWGIEEKKFNK